MARCAPMRFEEACDRPCRRRRLADRFKSVVAEWEEAGEELPQTRPEDARAAASTRLDDDALWMMLEKYAACEMSKADLERKFLSRHEGHNGKLVSALWRDRLGVETTAPSPQTLRVAELRRQLAAHEARARAVDAWLRENTSTSLAEIAGPVTPKRNPPSRPDSPAPQVRTDDDDELPFEALPMLPRLPGESRAAWACRRHAHGRNCPLPETVSP